MKVTEPVVQRKKKAKKLEDKEGDNDMVNLSRWKIKKKDRSNGWEVRQIEVLSYVSELSWTVGLKWEMSGRSEFPPVN